MKRFILFVLMLLPFCLKAQNPVIVSQPYKFQKWIQVLDTGYFKKNIVLGDVTNHHDSNLSIYRLAAPAPQEMRIGIRGVGGTFWSVRNTTDTTTEKAVIIRLNQSTPMYVTNIGTVENRIPVINHFVGLSYDTTTYTLRVLGPGGDSTIYKADGTIKAANGVRWVNIDTVQLTFYGIHGSQTIESDFRYDFANISVGDTALLRSSNIGLQSDQASLSATDATHGVVNSVLQISTVCCDVLGKRFAYAAMTTMDSIGRQKNIVIANLDGDDTGEQGIVFKDTRDLIGGMYPDTSYNANGRLYDRWIPSWGAVKSRVDSSARVHGNPGGSNTQVQYNNSGVLGGISGATTNGTTMTLTTPVINGIPTGTGVSVSSTVNTLILRDGNGNAFANNFISATTSTVSAGTTTTLVPNSTRLQILTGSSNQTYQLPNANASGMSVGSLFEFNNNSTGALTVTDHGGNSQIVLPSGGYARVIETNSGSANGAWDVHTLIPTNSTWGTAGLTVGGTTTLKNTAAGTPGTDSVMTKTSTGLVKVISPSYYAAASTIPVAANPTATATSTPVNGIAATFMRSDAAPKIDSTVFETVANFFPKGDTRYLTQTNAALQYIPNEWLVDYDIAKNPSSAIVTTTYDALPLLMQTNKNNLKLFYYSGVAHVSNSGVIKMRTSTDGGASFGSSTTILSTAGVDIRNPSGGVTRTGRIILYVMKYDSTSSTTSSQGYIYSDDQGSTWSSYTSFSGNSHTFYSPYGPLVNIGGGKIMQAWYGSGGPNNYSTYIRTSSDNGATWSSSVQVATSASIQYGEASYAYLDGGEIIGLVRNGAGTVFRQVISTDNGATWADQGAISFDATSLVSPDLTTFVDADGEKYVMAFWGNRTDNTIKAIVGTYSGLIAGTSGWIASTLTTLGTHTSTGLGYPSVVNPRESKKSIGVFYKETSSSVSNLYFFNYTPGPNLFNNLSFINSGFLGKFSPTTYTATRTYTLPDKTGTVAMTSDITAATDTTILRTVANSYSLASMQTKLNNYALLSSPQFTNTIGIGEAAASNVGIGVLSPVQRGIYLQENLTGGTGVFGISNNPVVQSDATGNAYIYRSQPSTAAAAFTLTNAYGYLADGITIGSGSTVTNQYGFLANTTLTTATNNYGFYSNIASGTNRWNFYGAGTATNHFNGNTGIGTTSTTAHLNLAAGSTSVAPLIIAAGTNLTSALSGAIEYDGTNLYFTDNTPTRQTVAVLASPVFTGTVSMPHLKGTGSAPSIVAGTGAGTSPTVSVSGTDMAGIVNITTGSSPSGSNAIVATITYATAYAAAPKGIILTPANTNAAALATTTQVFVPANGQTNGTTTTTFVVESNGTALAATTAYIWTYHVIQ